MIRIFDYIFSILLLLFFLPVMSLISLFILIFDGRPIIFKQYRVGYLGKKFTIYKYRTMNNNIFMSKFSRLTFFGKILRKSSLDELPQLFNVLKNDMSLVGPRPLTESIEKKIIKKNRRKRRKILPGLTGLSQINYSGKKRTLNQKVKLDIDWYNNDNLYNYFKILLKTPRIIILRFFKNSSSIIT